MRNTMKREYDFSKAKRGPVVAVPKGKTRITIRLDDEILTWFRIRSNAQEAATTRASSTRCCDNMCSKLVNLLRRLFGV
jgi:hypothetical protein